MRFGSTEGVLPTFSPVCLSLVLVQGGVEKQVGSRRLGGFQRGKREAAHETMDKARIKSPDKLHLPVAGDKHRAASKGSISPTKIESPKASSGLAKKDLHEEMEFVEETGTDEASLQKRCQVLKDNLAKERLLKAQVLSLALQLGLLNMSEEDFTTSYYFSKALALY